MFFTRSSSETRSARGQRPAVSWSQSALQLQGSPSAAQTTRERWKVCLPLFFLLFFSNNKSKRNCLQSPARLNKHFVSLCRWWSSTANRVRQPCVWTARRASTGSMWPCLCGTSSSSTRPCWRRSWMPYAAGGGLALGWSSQNICFTSGVQKLQHLA